MYEEVYHEIQARAVDLANAKLRDSVLASLFIGDFFHRPNRADILAIDYDTDQYNAAVATSDMSEPEIMDALRTIGHDALRQAIYDNDAYFGALIREAMIRAASGA